VTHVAAANGAPAVLTIDVEDWFQVENLRSAVPRESWGTRPLRVEKNVERILELMETARARATFFVLGWVAERCPGAIRRIAEAGHEIASHGYGHELLWSLTAASFRADVDRSKGVLEDLSSRPVVGYRAPCFSITDWAIPELQEAGFTYDSSVVATVAGSRRGRLAGVGPRDPVVELTDGFHEIGVSCLAIGPVGLPWGGGGYFRLLPYRVFRRGIAHIRKRGQPYVFYLHPWELDPGQPRVDGIPAMLRFRHYVGLGRCERRFETLLHDFRWSTMSELVDSTVARSANGRGA
jgi:polysaccharide deacetylase family protein (PEP-CTERM system associated)